MGVLACSRNGCEETMCETRRTCKEPDKPVNVDGFFSNPEFEYDA